MMAPLLGLVSVIKHCMADEREAKTDNIASSYRVDEAVSNR